MFVTAIAKRGSKEAGYLIKLSDGSSFFVSNSFFVNNQIANNLEVDFHFLELLENENFYMGALVKSFELTNRAEQSSGKLYLKLKKKSYPEFAIKAAIEQVISLGYLDDRRFSEMWLTSRLRYHPEGRGKLLQGLITRGVPSVTAKEVIAERINQEDLLDAVERAGNKILKLYNNKPDKIKALLFKKGFSNYEIKYFFDKDSV